MTESFDRNRFEQNVYNALSDLAQTMDILGQRQLTTEQNLNILAESHRNLVESHRNLAEAQRSMLDSIERLAQMQVQVFERMEQMSSEIRGL